jgi:hypothetical protein
VSTEPLDPNALPPGVHRLRPYSSKGKSKRLNEVLSALDRAVVVPALDAYAVSWLTQIGTSFKPEENRSVTEPGWAWNALSKYGAQPVSHPNLQNRGGANPQRRTTRSTTEDSTSRRVPPSSGSNDAGPSKRSVGQRLSVGGSGSHVRGNHSAKRESGIRIPDSGGQDERTAYRNALSAVHSALSLVGGRRRILPFSEVVDTIVHRTSFSGLPYLRDNASVLSQSLRLAELIGQRQRGFDPYLFGRRVQFKPGDDLGVLASKTRLVWMAPLATTIVGASFSEPIQKGLARKRPFTWGLSSAERGALVSSMMGRKRFTYALDFSRFDASVEVNLLLDIFDKIRDVLELTPEQGNLFDRYVNDFIHTRIVMPDGNIYQVHRGIPSGATFTSLIGSLVNVFVSNYVWLRATGRPLANEQLLVMGDDSLIASDWNLSPTRISELAHEVGFTVNPSKSETRDNEGILTLASSPHFLGYKWFKGRPHREVREVMKHLWHVERHHKPDEAWSLVRLGGFALTSVEGYSVLVQIVGTRYKTRDVTSLLLLYLELTRAAAKESQTTQWRIEWPGEIRRRIFAEGYETPRFIEGSGLNALLYGDSL